MKTVLIVDDDALIRAALHTIVDWEKLGFHIEADACGGEQAFQILTEKRIDLVFTDMKMPGMDGITLMRQIQTLKRQPRIVALSGYDDFCLVRSAFKLGAFDYVLKEDISEVALTELLKKISPVIDQEKTEQNIEECCEEKLLKRMAEGKEAPMVTEKLFGSNYVLVQFEIDEFKRNTVRFQDSFQDHLVRPMLTIASQISMIAKKCILTSLSPALYLMYVPTTEERTGLVPQAVRSVCRQLKDVWNNYMNVPISVGISRIGSGPEDFERCLKDTENQLNLRYLSGKATINYYGQEGRLDPEWGTVGQEKASELLMALQQGESLELEQQKRFWIRRLAELDLEKAKTECLYLVRAIALMMRENEDNIWSLFLGDVNYYEKIGRIPDARSLEMWMNNYISYVSDYIENTYDRTQMDLFQKARRFMVDNYSNPELTLKSVADHVGLNEKYFSSCFTKEFGNTFSNFLTEVRIANARELLRTTDMKMYEISQSVGYNNVEHFTRMFKKVCNVSPGAYKKQISDI